MSIRTKSGFVFLLTLFAVAVVARKPVRLGLDLRGGASLVLEADTKGSQSVLEETRRVVERKINAYGISEATVQPYGAAHDRLLVQIPDGNDRMDRFRESLTRRGVLEWFLVRHGPFSVEIEARAAVSAFQQRVLPTSGAEPAWYVLQGPAVLRGNDLKNARAIRETARGWATAFTFANQAGQRFGAFTEQHIGQPLAVVIDGAIVSVGTIQDRIEADGQIHGAGSPAEAEDLAILLRAGAVPAAVRILDENTVAPSLGSDSIRHGLNAGLAGAAAVVAAMLAVYRGYGWNAIATLALNALFLLTLLLLLDAALTLPGIAGLILTIGMAVDSNVLIFERVRELSGHVGQWEAVEQGFRQAWSTIFDTHITTLVSCAILFLMGTTAIRGFAVTLGLGLLTNLFTAVAVSKLLFEWRFPVRPPR